MKSHYRKKRIIPMILVKYHGDFCGVPGGTRANQIGDWHGNARQVPYVSERSMKEWTLSE